MSMKDRSTEEDLGLFSLVILLRHFGIQVEPDEITRGCGAGKIDITEILRCARAFGLHARVYNTNWQMLARAPLPGIAALNKGGFVVINKVEVDKALIARPGVANLESLTREQLEAAWDGRLVLMRHRKSLTDLVRGQVQPFADAAERGVRRLVKRIRESLMRSHYRADGSPINSAF